MPQLMHGAWLSGQCSRLLRPFHGNVRCVNAQMQEHTSDHFPQCAAVARIESAWSTRATWRDPVALDMAYGSSPLHSRLSVSMAFPVLVCTIPYLSFHQSGYRRIAISYGCDPEVYSRSYCMLIGCGGCTKVSDGGPFSSSGTCKPCRLTRS